MTRRAFLPAAASTLAAGNAVAADAAKNVILELRRIQLRNSPENQRQRNNDFLKRQVAAFERAGAGPTGVFSSTIAPDGPFLLVLASYASLSAMEQVQAKLAADTEYQKALDAYNALPGLNYQRMESSLLRAFDGHPNVMPPPDDGKRPARLFELRQYESNNTATLKRKIKGFNDGEIGALEGADFAIVEPFDLAFQGAGVVGFILAEFKQTGGAFAIVGRRHDVGVPIEGAEQAALHALVVQAR